MIRVENGCVTVMGDTSTISRNLRDLFVSLMDDGYDCQNILSDLAAAIEDESLKNQNLKGEEYERRHSV